MFDKSASCNLKNFTPLNLERGADLGRSQLVTLNFRISRKSCENAKCQKYLLNHFVYVMIESHFLIGFCLVLLCIVHWEVNDITSCLLVSLFYNGAGSLPPDKPSSPKIFSWIRTHDSEDSTQFHIWKHFSNPIANDYIYGKNMKLSYGTKTFHICFGFGIRVLISRVIVAFN